MIQSIYGARISKALIMTINSHLHRKHVNSGLAEIICLWAEKTALP
jgi:hypothetical protein